MDKELKLARRVKRFADLDKEYGWFVTEYEGKTYRFPRRALLHYTFGRSSFNDVLPPYRAVHPSSWKMLNDDPFHTDVIVGAGFDLDNAYERDHVEYQALIDARWKIEEDYDHFRKCDFQVLANHLPKKQRSIWVKIVTEENLHYYKSAKRNGEVSTPYLAILIPHAGIEYDLIARKVDVIITETGGKLCHLATVSRESRKSLIMMKNATERLDQFNTVLIDFDYNTLRVM